MSIPQTVLELLANKAVAGAAAAGLAIAGTAGLTTALDNAADHADDTAIERLQELADGDEEAEEAATTDEGEEGDDLTAAEVEVTEEEEEDEADDEGRADEVHAVLSGGEATPEDGADFGAAVSANAREHAQNDEPGSFGRSVASVASGGESDRGGDDDNGTEEQAETRERPESPEDSGRPEGTPPSQGEASSDSLDHADEQRSNRGGRG